MGQADAGLQQVKSLLKGTPEDREVYITLSQMYSRLKRWPEAEEALDKAEALSTKDEDKQYIYFLRGSTYERQKKYDPAEEAFRKVLVADPQNATALNYLGYMLADRGVKLDEALTLIKKAVDLDPSNGAYLDSLGWAYFRLGKYELAEDSADQSLAAYRHRSHSARPPRRSLPENRTSETGGRPLGSCARGVEQNRGRRSRSERRSPRTEETGIRQNEAGQRRFRQQVTAPITDHVGAGRPARPAERKLGFSFCCHRKQSLSSNKPPRTNPGRKHIGSQPTHPPSHISRHPRDPPPPPRDVRSHGLQRHCRPLRNAGDN